MSKELLQIEIEGDPVAKARPRVCVFKGRAHAFTPQKTVTFERFVQMVAKQAMTEQNFEKVNRPNGVRLKIESRFSVPKSWTKKEKLKALGGLKGHTSKPDVDNLQKAICDALNDVVFDDDSQVEEASIVKKYGETAGTTVTIELIER